MEWKNKKCLECGYFDDDGVNLNHEDPDSGMCRRFPPAIDNGDMYVYQGVDPYTKACGEFHTAK